MSNSGKDVAVSGCNRSLRGFYVTGVGPFAAAAILLVTIGSPLGADDSKEDRQTQEKEARLEAERAWTQMVKATKIDAAEFENDPDAAWRQVANEGLSPLGPLLRDANRRPRPHLRAKLAFLVEQFGKHGPVADMRWCTAQASEALMPAGHRNLLPQGNDREEQLIAAELKVRHFLAHPKLLARYCGVLAWESIWFDPSFVVATIAITRDKLRDAPPEEYWVDALNFMILAHATNRDDLLKDAKPEMLRERFETWYAWFEENSPYLRSEKEGWRWKLDENAKKQGLRSENGLPKQSSAPEKPFADWKGPVPPSRQFFQRLR